MVNAYAADVAPPYLPVHQHIRSRIGHSLGRTLAVGASGFRGPPQSPPGHLLIMGLAVAIGIGIGANIGTQNSHMHNAILSSVALTAVRAHTPPRMGADAVLAQCHSAVVGADLGG